MNTKTAFPEPNHLEVFCVFAKIVGLANAYAKDFRHLFSSIGALKGIAANFVLHKITPFAAWQLFRCAKYLLSVPLAGRHIIQHLFAVAKHNFYTWYYSDPLPALSFRPRIFRSRCALILRWVRMMHTVRRSCMTAGIGYGLTPFVKVRLITGFYIINRDILPFFCSQDKKFFQKTHSTKYSMRILTWTKYCGSITVVIDPMCASSFQEGRPSVGLGAISFALHRFAVRRPVEIQGKSRRRIWVLYYRQRDCYAHSGGICWRFCFQHRGNYSPARKAGMTGVHLRMSQAGNAGVQLFPLFYLPKRRKALRIIKK